MSHSELVLVVVVNRNELVLVVVVNRNEFALVVVVSHSELALVVTLAGHSEALSYCHMVVLLPRLAATAEGAEGEQLGIGFVHVAVFSFSS